ncbi:MULTISPECIES: hypothetical protein [Methylobacterium]|uniref:Uncharacterized protein n=2 Tax=Pseudomonadota TaxID=1224 RepID=A0ABQ4SZU4_9HYPH|nr:MULTISPECIES: hypothetical protein [Methylobacterium]PIU06767.1 MAG: hypothetical protein COT56_08175 [Methylobacterium sp. CG09_land_8_20_14_0_10_71_15]PIU14871.1 MAG: hypothetical protein COT28_06560 [Methylobacterium sp. CG08_land_8_20_14_0_20_71_15]GBU17969.1 hypothetical protein AwMethylo_21840 [Methylobacterium sp.]GJE07460.1 hypothetical protein AOPFMNJM_2789 [Methylobacterium jeotgali]
MLRHLIAGAALLALTTTARADMVAGWDVTPKPDDGICSVQYNYIDKDDGNARNAVNFTFAKKGKELALIMVFGYGKWEWTKGETAKADLLVDDTVEQRAVKWEATDKTVLLGTFTDPEGLLKSIGSGSDIGLRFDGDKDNEAWFKTPNVGQALGAVQICLNQVK